MNKIANLIVKYKKTIVFITLAATILCAWLIPKVNINYDLSEYLPQDSEVTNGAKLMEDKFGNVDSMSVMIENISTDEATEITKKLADTPRVLTVDFDAQNENYYKDQTALYTLTIDSADTKSTISSVREALVDYDTFLGGSAINSQAMMSTLSNEMPIFLAIAILLIAVILLLISNSWLEPLLFLSISAVAIIINYGSNVMFDNISFITFAIAALLQLALSMDYSIILLDQYHHELKDKTKDEAMKKAWRKSFSAISASALTTIFGLLAMVFMSFTIGQDLGIILAKGVFINAVVVFFCLPALILLADNLLNKTKKKSIKIPIEKLSRFGYKGRYIITASMLVLTIGAFFVQRNLDFTYSVSSTTAESQAIQEKFGDTSQFVVLYDNHNPENVKEVITFVDDYQYKEKDIIISFLDFYNTVGLPMTADELASSINISPQAVATLYTLYNQAHQTQLERIPLNEFALFIEQDVLADPKYQSMLTPDFIAMFSQAKDSMQKTQDLLQKDDYNRMIIKIKASVESDEAHDFYNHLSTTAHDNLDEAYILGETALANNIQASFDHEMLLITIITIVAMIVVIGLTHRSIGLPIILVLLIQGAIWISLCYPVIKGSSIFFLAYIIAQCIQMGATIDYAILLSSNYINNREKQDKKAALKNALKASIMTIFTSASILVVATFTIAIISSQEMISTICMVIGRGTIISVIVVLIALPAYLVLCDKFLAKTTPSKKFKK